MRVLILGGTGAIGILLIEKALAASHTVVIYARSPGKLPENISAHPNVVIVKGDLEDENSLSEALKDVHIVLSALGPSVQRGPLHPSGTPLAHAYSRLIKIMRICNVNRLIALGTASITDPNDRFSARWKAIVAGIATFAHNAYKDVVAIGETIRSEGSDLVWTVVRVPFLTDSDSEETVAGYVGDDKTTFSLSRVGFAVFVLQELESNQWARKAPLVTMPK